MPVPLLEGHQEYVDPIDPAIAALHDRIDDLESKIANIKRDAVIVVLNLLAKSLKHVASGEFDLDDIPTATVQPSKWEPIKKRLTPKLATAVDIFLAQGAMKRTQLAAAMRMDYSNCTKNVIAVLVRQGLLIESGGLLSLKEL